MSTGPNLLTDERIAAALKDGRRTWLSDDICLRGWGRLLARISNTATALFYFRYFIDGRYRSITLGPHSEYAREGFYTLEQARDEAARLSRLHRAPATRDVRRALNSALAIGRRQEPPTTLGVRPHSTSAAPEALGDHASAAAAAWASLTFEQLQREVWRLPRVQLAKIYNVSDVAIGKRCKRLGIKMPPPGYWARVASGKEPPPNGIPCYDWKPNSTRRASSIQRESGANCVR